ncbi:TPA: hypothetical protein OTQ61_003185 [Citrobacter koseri]|uniref:hypothetical protein n=1 Tax=Citrobacter TaxID=544 RepID=UPI000CE67CE1|nr:MULTISPECIES: hypothetical protein [Citrobacter]AVE59928.1 hypothetical protein AM352_16875 [Citrobacter koseri]MDM3035217.1 hypothetical protein [Citrobacter sp. CK186]MDQ2324516.1 hypothetical protein [Citrobacter koseri]WOI92486.1 hypothetical protein R1016_12285 [Citrobacter koseri]WOJ15748.1 hypothetical protein R1018_12260 [Citrobacter koseri]
MEFKTNHDKSTDNTEYGFRIYEDLGDGKGVNSADIGVWIENYIDSRTELNTEIKKQSLAFLKRAVEQLESELER